MRYPNTISAMALVTLSIAGTQAAWSQENAARITGAVVDSLSGIPIANVAVYVDGRNLADSTDSAGEFSLSGLSTGEHYAYLMGRGYLPTIIQFALPGDLSGDSDIGVIFLSPGAPPLAKLSGTVVDVESEQPVVGASIALNGDAGPMTDDVGAFRIPAAEVRWGINILEFRRIGYVPLLTELWIAQEETDLDFDIAMVPSAVRMAEVVVEGNRVLVPARLAGFYERREVGIGEFLTEADWEDRADSYVGQVLHRMPGINVAGWRVLVHSVPYNCRRKGISARIWVDGVSVNPEFIQDMNIADVFAMEVYKRIADIPARYNTNADQKFGGGDSVTSAACGVILIWRR